MLKHFPPKHGKKEFHCIYCGVFSAQNWSNLYYWSGTGYLEDNHMEFCICSHCKQWSYWHNKKMIIPAEAPVPPAHHDMPEECISEYQEARNIVASSPRAAAALLRLAVQKLMIILGGKGKNINEDIKKLVENGLPTQVQQALDFCRVVGNNAVHPGEIELNDTPEIAHNLFNMINYIVEDRISRPKHIQSLYNLLPEDARKAVAKRDNAET